MYHIFIKKKQGLIFSYKHIDELLSRVLSPKQRCLTKTTFGADRHGVAYFQI